MSQQHQRETADRIVPGVRDHSCPQTSPQQREHAKHRAIRGDQQYSRDSFISVSAAKHQCGERDADPDPAPHASKLLLQITAEDQFLADSGRDAQHQEEQHFESRDRGEFLGHVSQSSADRCAIRRFSPVRCSRARARRPQPSNSRAPHRYPPAIRAHRAVARREVAAAESCAYGCPTPPGRQEPIHTQWSECSWRPDARVGYQSCVAVSLRPQRAR